MRNLMIANEIRGDARSRWQLTLYGYMELIMEQSGSRRVADSEPSIRNLISRDSSERAAADTRDIRSDLSQ